MYNAVILYQEWICIFKRKIDIEIHKFFVCKKIVRFVYKLTRNDLNGVFRPEQLRRNRIHRGKFQQTRKPDF